MTIREWMDSEPMRQVRQAMFGDKKNSFCSQCYQEEKHSGTSRRHRSNQKSVIFTRSNFSDSYQQSPGYDRFESSRRSFGAHEHMPIDVHIDLGNYCNLACKMCWPRASSTIAVQHVKWKIESARQYVGTDWTRNQEIWQRTIAELADTTNLRNVHFMGGETLITRRFEDFVDYMIERKRFDLNFSFVTNGTTFNPSLMEKLTKFRRIGIEVSIETMSEHNAYQRQGTDTSLVLENINRFLEYCNNDRVTVTIRPTISTLTIGNYTTLLEYCLARSLVVKSLLCNYPRYYDAQILPQNIKDLYLDRYRDFLVKHDLGSVDLGGDYNESDPGQIRKIIKQQVLQCMHILEMPAPEDSNKLLSEMVSWCRRWDDVYGLDARKLYPEFKKILDEHQY